LFYKERAAMTEKVNDYMLRLVCLLRKCLIPTGPKHVRICLIVLIILTLWGCGGAKCLISADKIEQPISFSKAVFDREGNVFAPQEKDVIKHFSFGWKHWTVFWTLIPLNDVERDISDLLRNELESAPGDAIVNLTIKATGDGLWLISSLLPIIPDYLDIQVEGDVVKVSSE
jgi:hypothetical protein